MSVRTGVQFADFLKKFDRITIFSLSSILTFTFVLDFVFSLQPPWPKSATYMTAFLELATIFCAFFWNIRSKKMLRSFQVKMFIAMMVLFFAYFILYSYFIFEIPGSKMRVVAGFVCTNSAMIVAEMLSERCPFLTMEALSAATYEVEKVWMPWSVRLVEFTIFFIWSSFFVIASAIFGVSIAFIQRYDRAS